MKKARRVGELGAGSTIKNDAIPSFRPSTTVILRKSYAFLVLFPALMSQQPPSHADTSSESSLIVADQEIALLTTLLAKKKKERNSHIKACSLPVEILDNVFRYVVDEWFSQVTTRTKHSRDWRPSIVQVCDRWRLIAHAYPYLWSRVALNGSHGLFEQCMKLSRDIKLAVTTFPDHLTEASVPYFNQELCQLAQCLSRIKSLILKVATVDQIATMFSSPSPSPLPQLTEIDIQYDLRHGRLINSFFGRPSTSVLQVVKTTFQSRVPNLRILVIRGPGLALLQNQVLPSSLAKLYFLDQTEFFASQSVIQTLPPVQPAAWMSLKGLRFLRIFSQYIVEIPLVSGSIQLPALERLDVNGQFRPIVADFLRSVTLPSHTCISIVLVTNIANLQGLQNFSGALRLLADTGPDSKALELTMSVQEIDEKRNMSMSFTLSTVKYVAPRLYVSLSHPALTPSLFDSLPGMVGSSFSSCSIQIRIIHRGTSFINSITAATREIANRSLSVATEPSTQLTVRSLPIRTRGTYCAQSQAQRPWMIEMGSVSCEIRGFRMPAEQFQAYLVELILVLTSRSITSFSLLHPEYANRYYLPPILHLGRNYYDWIGLLGFSPTLEEIWIESLLDIDTLITALELIDDQHNSVQGEESDDENPPNFSSLKRLSLKNVSFGEGIMNEGGLFSVLKRRHYAGLGLERLDLNGCLGISLDAVENLKLFIPNVWFDDFYQRAESVESDISE
ncbi:hypothetical protein DL96DRAFT_1556397 [Flagelloscypha sp. PMI_526]|nr:hypothetical protein DL96DRAFT_1556397 [Flagelloscypha sp. PMI_526]